VTRKSPQKKKLHLKRERIRTLSNADLEQAVGGLPTGGSIITLTTHGGSAINCPVTENFCTIIKGGTTNHNQSLLRRRGR
jgi:hypothetical protein